MNRPENARRAAAVSAAGAAHASAIPAAPRSALPLPSRHFGYGRCSRDHLRRTARESPPPRAGSHSLRLRHHRHDRSTRSSARPKRERSAGSAFIGTLVALASVHLMAAITQGLAYSDLISDDRFSIFVHVVVIAAAALAILGSLDYLDEEGIAARRILRARVVRHGRHGHPGGRERTRHRVRRPRNELDFHLRARRLPPPRAEVERSLAEIFPARLVRHRLLPLRHRHDLRRHGHHAD